MHVSKPDLHAVMKQDSAGAGSSRRGGRLRATLVGVQVALCMVLMIAAGLVLRGLYATYTIDPGFEYRNVAFVSLESAFDGYSPEESEARRRRLMADLEALPGVEAVASTDQEPLGDDMAPALFRLPGESERQSRVGEVITVSQDYFSVLELPIVRGRAFTEDEVEEPRRADAASGHPERNDGAQPLARRRPDRPDAAVGNTWHERRRHPAGRRRGRGCAGHRSRTNRSLLRVRARRREARCSSRAAPTSRRRCRASAPP